MSDGHYPTLVSKDRYANAVGNPIWLELSDGSAALHKAVDGVAGATDTGLLALVVRDDALSALGPADGDYTQLRVNATGALWVEDISGSAGPSKTDDDAFGIGTDKVSPAGFLADEGSPDSVDEGDIGLARMTLDRRQLFVLTDATTASQRLAITSNGEAKVDISAQSLTAVKISKDASANSQTNPIYVQVVSGVISGNEIHSYDTTVDVASDTPDNHDYTVAGTTFMLKSVIFAASGGLKVEIQTGPVASLATKAVAFIPKEGGFGQVFFDPPIEVPATSTGTVRVIRTNRQGQAQDVYSTIIGNDVA